MSKSLVSMRFACKDCDGKDLMQLPCAALQISTLGAPSMYFAAPAVFLFARGFFHFSVCGVVCVLMIFMVSTFANGFGIQ